MGSPRGFVAAAHYAHTGRGTCAGRDPGSLGWRRPSKEGLLSRKLLALAASLAAPAALAPAAAQARDVTVMTRNVYLGADLIPLATAPADQFRHAATGVFDSVVAGDPDGRMRLIAGEIAKARPDLVGLQEVSLWR